MATTKKEIRLGNVVKDLASGIQGIVVSKLEHFTGCIQYGVTPTVKKDAVDVVTLYIDKDRLEYVSDGMAKKFEIKTPGGPVLSSKSMRTI
jgi:hypothetical protein